MSFLPHHTPATCTVYCTGSRTSPCRLTLQHMTHELPNGLLRYGSLVLGSCSSPFSHLSLGSHGLTSLRHWICRRKSQNNIAGESLGVKLLSHASDHTPSPLLRCSLVSMPSHPIQLSYSHRPSGLLFGVVDVSVHSSNSQYHCSLPAALHKNSPRESMVVNIRFDRSVSELVRLLGCWGLRGGDWFDLILGIRVGALAEETLQLVPRGW